DLPRLFGKAKAAIDNLEKNISQNEALKALLKKNSSFENMFLAAKDFVNNFNVFAATLTEIDKETGLFSNPESFKTLIKNSIKDLEAIIKDFSSGISPELIAEVSGNINQITGVISKITTLIDSGKKR
ncbi:MAG: hypothetical protein ABIJ94_02770, partial [candidate division WOR-3 bacterium]